MNTPNRPTALIAEDEPLLAAALQAELKKVWPELEVVAVVGNGKAAVEKALALTPDVVFLDIRMPGLTGLEAAAELADEWPAEDGANQPPFPALVFVTAYDEYALQAFEAQAMDYVLKPVQTERLARTAQRVQAALAQRVNPSTGSVEPAMDATLAQLRALLGGPESTSVLPERLKVIQASVGHAIHMVPVSDVVVFEAADKYVRVLTAAHEYLIRTPLKDLLPQLDPSEFWQVHRGTVVRATAIDSVQRDEAGRTSLLLRQRDGQRIAVSRVYAARFRAM